MVRKTHFIIFISCAIGLISSIAHGQTAHLANKEIPFKMLFKNYPTRMGRFLSSSQMRGASPSLTFEAPIALNSNGEARLGKTCYIRNITSSQRTSRDFFSSALSQSPGGQVMTGSPFEMELISFQPESLRLELISKNAPVQRLELGCAHPEIQSWSVADFEAYSGNQLWVKVPSQLLAKSSRQLLIEAVTPMLGDLKGNRFNGAFGSGLPGTSGIQLLFGANLKAYENETNISLLVGRRCQIVSQANRSMGDRYLKGSKFGFQGYHVNAEAGTVELVFDNWNHSPHQIRVECIGSESEIKQMSVAEVEHDLNGAIRIYRK